MAKTHQQHPYTHAKITFGTMERQTLTHINTSTAAGGSDGNGNQRVVSGRRRQNGCGDTLVGDLGNGSWAAMAVS